MPKFVITDPIKMIEILPSLEPQELKIPPFTMTLKPRETISDHLPPVMATEPIPTSAQKQPPVPTPPATVPIPVSKPLATTPASKEPINVPASHLPAATPAPVSSALGTARVKLSPAPGPAGLTMAADEGPYPFVLSEAGEYVIIVEKDGESCTCFSMPTTGWRS